MLSEIGKFFNAHLELFIAAIVAIVGGFVGAWAGARSAQKSADRSKNIDVRTREIRSTNAAIMVVFAICNSMLGLKKQYLKPIKQTFDAHRAEFDQWQDLRSCGKIEADSIFTLKLDGRTLASPSLPIEVLQRTVFDDLSLVGRPLALQIVIGQTAKSLADAIDKRNEVIRTFKSDPAVRLNLLQVYFGLKQSSGVLDESYASSLEAINRFTDDLIFFGLLLLKDLKLHVTELSIEFREPFGGPLIQTSDPDFSQSDSLFPNEAEYADWIAGFVVRPRLKRKQRSRFVGFFLNLKELAVFGGKNG